MVILNIYPNIVLPPNIRIYEIGTGRMAFETLGVFRITALAFSTNGEFLVSAGKEGKIAIWSTNEEVADSIREVIQHMHTNPFFWNDYPIELKEQVPQEIIVL
jgi:WD40 repeat protein